MFFKRAVERLATVAKNGHWPAIAASAILGSPITGSKWGKPGHCTHPLGYNEHFAEKVIAAVRDEYRKNENELSIQTALQVINASVAPIKKYEPDRIELMSHIFRDAGIRTLSEACPEVLQGLDFVTKRSVGEDAKQQDLVLNAGEQMFVKNFLTVHASVMTLLAPRDASSAPTGDIGAASSKEGWANPLGKMILAGASNEAIGSVLRKASTEEQMAARENILKAAEALKEQDLDLPHIMEQRATTLQERGMGDLTHALVPPKKLISELQRSVDAGQLQYGLADVMIPVECAPAGCEYKTYTIHDVKIATFQRVPYFYAALRNFLTTCSTTLRKGMSPPTSAGKDMYEYYLATPDIVENHFYNCLMQQAHHPQGIYYAMAYDQLGRKQLASRIGHRIRSVEDYRKQITDLPFDEHFNNDVKQIATALEHLIQDNVRKERAKQEKSQKNDKGKSKGKKSIPCRNGDQCTIPGCPYQHSWDSWAGKGPHYKGFDYGPFRSLQNYEGTAPYALGDHSWGSPAAEHGDTPPGSKGSAADGGSSKGKKKE